MSQLPPESSFDLLLQDIEDELQQTYPFYKAYARDADRGFAEILSETVARYPGGAYNREYPTHVGHALAINSLIYGLRKRYIGPTSYLVSKPSDVRNREAEAAFVASNRRCQLHDALRPYSTFSDFTKVVLTEASLLIEDWFGGSTSVFSLSSLSEKVRTGPGAVSGIKTREFPASQYVRLSDSPMTFTSSAAQSLYRAVTLATPLTTAAEKARFSKWGHMDVVDSRAIFLSVPKTNVKDRGICTHSSGNQALQLAVHGVIADVLQRRCNLNLENQQERNKHLARLGSMGPFRITPTVHLNWCTWDGTDASNFPISFAEHLLPSNVMQLLNVIRSPVMELQDGTYITKYMMSTMGNGFTFALMTLLFSSIVVTLYRLGNLPLTYVDDMGLRQNTWAVFGDDIIVDRSVYPALLSVMTECGILTNVDKSYSEGHFRESCGGDFYDGYDVRPVFCETLTTLSDHFSLYNRLVTWCCKNSVLLPNSLKNLRERVTKAYYVPNSEGLDIGFHISRKRASLAASVLKASKNFGKSSFELKTFRLLQEDYQGGMLYLGYYADAPRYFLKKEKGHYAQYSSLFDRRVYRRFYITEEVYRKGTNLYGFLLYTLSGDVKDGAFGYRSPTGVERRKEKLCYTPSWGCVLSKWYFGGYTKYRLERYRQLEMYLEMSFISSGSPDLV